MEKSISCVATELPGATHISVHKAYGVALHSQHMEAKAIDIRVPGATTLEVRDAALSMQRGGGGYYAQSAFVHADVEPVRSW